MPFSLAAYAARAPRRVSLFAVLLCAPALSAGLVLDDYYLADHLRPGGAGVFRAFTFARDLAAQRELGDMPWWSDPGLRLDFLRPLAALTHLLDFRLGLPPWLMHVESALWLLALNLSAAAWYRRFFAAHSSSSGFGVALALYVLAPGHALAGSWLANRNSVLAALFAVLAAISRDRARQGEGARFAWGARLLLLASLASGELGVSALGLSIAHAVFLDRAPDRFRALAPDLLLVLGWSVLHHALGYGARASGLYVDPLEAPGAFAAELPIRLPILLFGQWGLPLVSFTGLLSRQAVWALWALSLVTLALWTPALVRVLRCDARARFAALASVLCALPVLATVPHDRLTILADLPAFALIALVVSRSGATALWLRVRLSVSCLLALGYAASLHDQVAAFQAPFARALHDPALAQQSLIFVNAPTCYGAALFPRLRARDGGPVPARMRVLSPGIYPLTITRLGPRTLSLFAAGGLLQPIGSWRGEAADPPGWFSPVYMVQLLNQFARRDWNFQASDRIELSDLTVVITESTPAGFPRRVRFEFAAPLEHPRYRFVRWQDSSLAPFVLPRVGQSVRLPPVLH